MRPATHEEFCDILDTEDLTPEECLGAWYVNMYGVFGFDEIYFTKRADDTYMVVFENTGYSCHSIEEMVEWIRKELIIPSLVEESLFTTCHNIQARVGQTAGDIAGSYFSDDKYEDLMLGYVLQELTAVEPIVEDLLLSSCRGQLDISLGKTETYSIDLTTVYSSQDLKVLLDDTHVHINNYAEIIEYARVVINLSIDLNNEMTVRRGFNNLFIIHTAGIAWLDLAKLCDDNHLREEEKQYVLNRWLANLNSNEWIIKGGINDK